MRYVSETAYLLPVGTRVVSDKITGTIVGTATMHEPRHDGLPMTMKYLVRLDPEHRGYVAQQGPMPADAATHDTREIFISTIVADAGNLAPIEPARVKSGAVEWAANPGVTR